MTQSIKHDREFKFTKKDFDELRKLSNAYTGIIVSDDKFDMYYARLSKRLRTLHLNSFKEYVEYLKNNDASEFTPFINSITTNLTSFFRENHHFEYMKQTILPAVSVSGSGAIKVWSAGCSTGEEAYSISIVLADYYKNKFSYSAKIFASDIDTTVLATAALGVYDESKLKNIDNACIKKWFLKGKDKKKGFVRVKKQLQDIISFSQVNLIMDWPIKEKFNVIFCRNVIIYFDKPTKISLLSRLIDQLTPGGFLILGHSESVQGLTDRLKTVGKTMYQKVK